MSEPYRPITEYERSLVEPLYEAAIRGGWANPTDLAVSRVRLVAVYKDNYGSIEFEYLGSPGAPPSVMVAEGRGKDEDGVPIEYFLHVKDHGPYELEVVKMDGTSIRRFPAASEINWSQRR
jgi:hypothetical protein